MTLILANGNVSEEAIHKGIIQYIRNHPRLKIIQKLIMHFPNEGKRSLRYGKLMKDLGLRAGVSDLFIAMPAQGFNGAWVEIKSKGGITSPNQKEFLCDMTTQNYFTAVCWSIDEGITLLDWYCLGRKWFSWADESQYRTNCQLTAGLHHEKHLLS